MKTTLKKISVVSAVPLLAIAVVAGTLSLQADAANTTVNSTIGSTIGVFTTSGTVALNALPTSAGVQTTAQDTITVSTNNSAGYNLQLNESTADTTLKDGTKTIAATTGTVAAPIALAANTWGFRVDSATVGGFGATTTVAASNAAIGTVKYAAVPTAATTIKTTSANANNDTTSVWYSVAVNNNTASGSYSNTVTYTAVNN